MDNLSTLSSQESPLRPSRRELASAARRLAEDLDLVGLLAQKATYGDALAPEIRSVLAEACLERVLKIVRFMYCTGGDDLAVCSSDFVADADLWSRERPPMPGVIATHLPDLETLLSSDRWMLTDCRRAFSCWPLASFAHELEELMDAFGKQLTAEVTRWFERGTRSSPMH